VAPSYFQQYLVGYRDDNFVGYEDFIFWYLLTLRVYRYLFLFYSQKL